MGHHNARIGIFDLLRTPKKLFGFFASLSSVLASRSKEQNLTILLLARLCCKQSFDANHDTLQDDRVYFI